MTGYIAADISCRVLSYTADYFSSTGYDYITKLRVRTSGNYAYIEAFVGCKVYTDKTNQHIFKTQLYNLFPYNQMEITTYDNPDPDPDNITGTIIGEYNLRSIDYVAQTNGFRLKSVEFYINPSSSLFYIYFKDSDSNTYRNITFGLFFISVYTHKGGWQNLYASIGYQNGSIRRQLFKLDESVTPTWIIEQPSGMENYCFTLRPVTAFADATIVNVQIAIIAANASLFDNTTLYVTETAPT